MIAEFAQIVGLLAAFSSERNAGESAGAREFLEWLTEHNHAELRRSIEQNQSTTISIKAMLNRGFEDIGEKLEGISNQLAILASRSDGIIDLATSYSQALLSDQAYKVLRTMEENASEYLLLLKSLTGPAQLLLVPGPQHSVEEPRFLHDDLEMLLGLGLLNLGYSKNGEPLYRATRAGSQLVKRSR